jgi:hypothetical protein
MSVAFYEAWVERKNGIPDLYYVNPMNNYLTVHFFLLNTQYLVGDTFLVSSTRLATLSYLGS